MNPLRWLLWKLVCLPWGHTPGAWEPMGQAAFPGLQPETTKCTVCRRLLGRTVKSNNGLALVHDFEVVD